MHESQPFWDRLSPESLHPLLENQMLIVMGGGKGDEGKWGDAYAMAQHWKYSLIVWPVGGPNAGHTVVRDDEKKFVWHNLPWAALSGKPVYLWQGKYINITGLEKEALELQAATQNKPKIYIASGAHVILKSLHVLLDKAIEQARSGKVGTTGSGMWPVVAMRGLRTNMNIWQFVLLEGETLAKFARELIAPWNESYGIKLDDVIAEIKSEQKVLQWLITDEVVEIVGDDFVKWVFQNGNPILVEWAQSPSLGMFGGSYPNNTSTDTNFLGILSSLGIRPIPGRVAELLVVKAFPSAVGTHTFPERVSHIFPELLPEEEKFGRDTGEYGATTGRPRMIAFPSPALVHQQLYDNAPYTRWLSVRKLDLVERFRQQVMNWQDIPLVTWYQKNGTPIVINQVPDAQELVWHYRNAIQSALPWENNFTLIGGFGPAPKDSRVL